jgi:hypothetical protein
MTQLELPNHTTNKNDSACSFIDSSFAIELKVHKLYSFTICFTIELQWQKCKKEDNNLVSFCKNNKARSFELLMLFEERP